MTSSRPEANQRNTTSIPISMIYQISNYSTHRTHHTHHTLNQATNNHRTQLPIKSQPTHSHRTTPWIHTPQMTINHTQITTITNTTLANTLQSMKAQITHHSTRLLKMNEPR